VSAAHDRYAAYYAEKIWEMIPAFYRDEDGRAVQPDVLRSIVEILAEQAAHLRRSTDELWDDAFIDLCRSWAIPYLGELVATRLVASENLRASRIAVAKTIYYRRRKGTLRVLEELISDMTGWEGVVKEEFRRLARPWHALDPDPLAAAGRFTGTKPGSWANLRGHGNRLATGPFNEYAHYVDVRRAGRTTGRRNIPKITFHLYRILSFSVSGVVPGAGKDDEAATFDPSGRDIQLFNRRHREGEFDWDQWRSLDEWELPAPMRCRVLGHAEFRITEALIARWAAAFSLTPDQAAELQRLNGLRIPSEARLRESLAALPSGATFTTSPVFDAIVDQALVQDCAKSILLPSSEPPGSTRPKSIRVRPTPGVEIPGHLIASANLGNANWAAPAPGKSLVIDPERGRMRFLTGPPPDTLRVDYQYGFSAEIGAGTYDRSRFLSEPTVAALSGGGTIAAASIDAQGCTQIDDCATYGPVANKSGFVKAVIQAAGFQRPYVRLASSWSLDTGVNDESELVLDGLWIGGAGAFSIRLLGDWERVTLRHMTLDPGGTDAIGQSIAPVTLVVAGDVETLIVLRSIAGPIRAAAGATIGKVIVRDSIVQSLDPDVPAIDVPAAELELTRTTVFGDVNANRLIASEALLTGTATVADTQSGCFRFSAAASGSRVPRPYESHFFDELTSFFVSRAFGHYAFAQLSQIAPAEVRRGAENDSEIGAFSGRLNPIRMDGLRTRVDEFLPFGLVPVYVFET
jgi:hypothetical protein